MKPIVSGRVLGLRETARAFDELPKATARNVAVRVLKAAAEPFVEDYRAGVDVQTGTLRDGIGVSTQLTKRQAKLARRQGKAFAEVYAGASEDPAAHLEEFGSIHNAPNPAARVAWDRNGDRAMDIVAEQMGGEVDKAARRIERKLARGR